MYLKDIKIENPLQEMKTFLLIGMYLYRIKGLSKGLVIFLTASASVPLIDTLKKYIVPDSFDNWVIFIILLILDVGSGVYKHSGIWKKEQPNTLNKDDFFYKLFRKVFAGAIWLMLINVIINTPNATDYFDSFGIGALISWLGWSIASNIYVISGSTFPPEWVMEKLRRANKKQSK